MITVRLILWVVCMSVFLFTCNFGVLWLDTYKTDRVLFGMRIATEISGTPRISFWGINFKV